MVSYGLIKGKGWAWSITLILSYISIVVGIVSLVGGNILSIIPIIISGVIIWYLYKQEIKRFFGKLADAKISGFERTGLEYDLILVYQCNFQPFTTRYVTTKRHPETFEHTALWSSTNVMSESIYRIFIFFG